MNKYKENPKTKGSGIVCCIPQKGTCPNNCKDCFFQSGRSFLEPLKENLPNIPNDVDFRVVRMNDGNDSNIQQTLVREIAERFPMKFFNTAIPRDLECFEAPIVLTLNPGDMTDKEWHKLLDPMPKNLMFVRIRVNSWNLYTIKEAVEYYSKREIPIVLTFMAYFDTPIKKGYEEDYTFRKRTLNSYNAITTKAWESIMKLFKYNKWVYSCGKIEGEKGTSACARCGNCIREYFVTMERLR